LIYPIFLIGNKSNWNHTFWLLDYGSMGWRSFQKNGKSENTNFYWLCFF